jgi:hypothetical protein
VNPQQLRDKIRHLLQMPAAKPTQVFKNILNTPQTPTGLPLPQRKQQQDTQRWLSNLVAESGDDSQALIQLLQREGKQAVSKLDFIHWKDREDKRQDKLTVLQQIQNEIAAH